LIGLVTQDDALQFCLPERRLDFHRSAFRYADKVRRGTLIYSNGARKSSISARVQRVYGLPRLQRGRLHERARRFDDTLARDELFGIIQESRRARVLDWIDGLGLPAGSPALEIGPGAGVMTVALAERGFTVHAADTTPRLLDVARERVAAAGVAPRVRLLLADAQRLPFAGHGFSLVVALGVLPWLPSASPAIAEIARLLRPGGYLVLNADNSGRLALLLDPRHNPALAPARLAARSLLHSAGMPRPAGQMTVAPHRLAEFDTILKTAGLELLRRSTLGFGPFTMFGRPVTSARAGIRLNARLQRLADQGMPGFRSAGAQYLVLARAPAAGPIPPRDDPAKPPDDPTPPPGGQMP
jgi:ubiquinone/menaquinone biosynthesis C-methylase UbiE